MKNSYFPTISVYLNKQIKKYTMKKILLSIATVLAVGYADAQFFIATDSSDFAMWQKYDADGDTYNWSARSTTGAGTVFAGQGGVFRSESYVNGVGALNPDNLAISPAINCSGKPTVFLTWGAGSQETTASTWYQEYYSVYIVNSVAAILAGSYPTPVYSGALSAGEVMEWKSIDVSSMAGNQGTVYIVLRHHNCTDQFQLFIDGVQLSTAALGLEEESSMEATVFPNPANSMLNVRTTGAANKISILSMDGKVVSSTTMSGMEGSIDVSSLTEGVYFYEVAGENGATIRNTFVKK